MWRFTSPKSNRNSLHDMNTLNLYKTFCTEKVTFTKFTATCMYISLCYLLLNYISFSVAMFFINFTIIKTLYKRDIYLQGQSLFNIIDVCYHMFFYCFLGWLINHVTVFTIAI